MASICAEVSRAGDFPELSAARRQGDVRTAGVAAPVWQRQQVLWQNRHTSLLKAICRDIGIEGDVVKEIDELAAMVERVAASGYPQGPIPVSPETLRRVGEGIAEKARETLSAMDVQDVTTRVVDGDPAGNIIAAAEHENAELVVMGRRGLGNVAGLVMGSVSHKVAHLASARVSRSSDG